MTNENSENETKEAAQAPNFLSAPALAPPLPKKRAFIPMPGMAWNPLLRYPRNRMCPCLSGKKFKACCLLTLPRVVPSAVAKTYAEAIASGKPLHFIQDEEKKPETEGDHAAAQDPGTPADQGNA